MADVQRAVGVGRAVVQHEERAAARAFAQALPEPQALPALQHLRLALRQVALHGKGGAGQEHGAAVIARGGGGWRRYGGVGHVGASRTAACVAGGGGAWVWRAARTPALGGGPGREFAHGRGARRPAGPCSCYGKMGGCGSSGTGARRAGWPAFGVGSGGRRAAGADAGWREIPCMAVRWVHRRHLLEPRLRAVGKCRRHGADILARNQKRRVGRSRFVRRYNDAVDAEGRCIPIN